MNTLKYCLRNEHLLSERKALRNGKLFFQIVWLADILNWRWVSTDKMFSAIVKVSFSKVLLRALLGVEGFWVWFVLSLLHWTYHWRDHWEYFAAQEVTSWAFVVLVNGSQWKSINLRRALLKGGKVICDFFDLVLILDDFNQLFILWLYFRMCWGWVKIYLWL